MSPAESAGLAGAIRAKVAIPTHYHFALRGVPSFLARRMDVGHQAAAFTKQLGELSPKVKGVELAVGESFVAAPIAGT